jgi:hypothetical protein
MIPSHSTGLTTALNGIQINTIDSAPGGGITAE